MKKIKHKISILIIFSFILFDNCASNLKYETFNQKAEINDNLKQSFTLEFNNFENLPLLINIKIQNIMYTDSQTLVCEEKSKINYNIKFDQKPIKLNLENDKFCVSVFLHYFTDRPYQKNFKAGLLLNLNSDKNCFEQPRLGSNYINEFQCPFLDLSNSSRKIIFSNISTDRTDEQNAILTWGITLSAITRPPPILYLAPIPMFISGYTTKVNKIEFDIQ
ncbi:hypothetical protein [Leptospira levettii]|uniref:hypothetical protein n=1 Tax=Leptospira levettii TaxID=2023178 RepID=UPI000C29A1B4|nr:hypothetical protein [Leptospira levettii]PJZ86931.1 hypothetical protein CH368_19460 [Leptospira levettii]